MELVKTHQEKVSISGFYSPSLAMLILESSETPSLEITRPS